MSTAYPWVEPPWTQTELPREQLEDRIQQLLGSNNMCVMATVNAKGAPIASPIEFYADGLTLYMLPDPGTPKIKALLHDPRLSVAVHAPYHGWHSGRGAQFFGKAELIEPHTPGWERGMQIFRWHEWMRDLGMDPSQPFEKTVLKLEPDRILYTEAWLWKLGFCAKQKWLRNPAPADVAPATGAA